MKMSDVVLNALNSALECMRQAYDLVDSHYCWRAARYTIKRIIVKLQLITSTLSTDCALATLISPGCLSYEPPSCLLSCNSKAFFFLPNLKWLSSSSSFFFKCFVSTFGAKLSLLWHFLHCISQRSLVGQTVCFLFKFFLHVVLFSGYGGYCCSY